ncbi:MarR family transcriptional regulator [Endozoicomonas sp. 4G]|uniref:MarR family winged helix-turn-helix transcriptional regulator n=1 Tax=Endozoicomonas sp. 4G TaxID=2872754 RepID=UPI00207902B7|nr:MarR family transcriptional regulator [Endozoicomonas sp. 4G]
MNDDDMLRLENQVCFPLYSASNAMTRLYRPILKKIDLTYPQYLVMMVLWERDSIPVKDLGHRLFLDTGTLTPLLKRLESKGVLTRTKSQVDERVRVISLTGSGKKLKEKALSVPSSLRCKVNLKFDEAMELKRLCEKLMGELE